MLFFKKRGPSADERIKAATESLYKQNLELAVKNKTLSLLAKLYEISMLTLEPFDLAGKVCDVIRADFAFEFVALTAYDRHVDVLKPLAFADSARLHQAAGTAPGEIRQASRTGFYTAPIIRHEMEHAEDPAAVWGSGLSAETASRLKAEGHLRSSLAYPLVVGNRVVGVLAIGLNRPFSELVAYEREAIRSFISVIAISLDAAMLYERLRLANDALETANTKLESLNRQKTEFVSIASHQLRSPLTAIKGYASMMLEGSFGDLNDRAREATARIFESSQKLVTVIEDFLNVTRIELGKMRYEMAPLDLRKLVETVANELKPNFERKGLSLKVVSGEPCAVVGDQGKLAQVASNLIDNSIKYTPAGSVTVALEAKDGKVLFSVQDTGIGIAPEVLPKLFEKFIRADDAGKTNIQGTGLGLYVAKQMVEAHGGRLWAESEGAGKGSVFKVELPLASADKASTA